MFYIHPSKRVRFSTLLHGRVTFLIHHICHYISARGTPFIVLFTFTFAAVGIKITRDFAPIGLRSSVGRGTMIKSGGRGFDSCRGQRFFLCLGWCPVSLQGITKVRNSLIHFDTSPYNCRVNSLFIVDSEIIHHLLS